MDKILTTARLTNILLEMCVKPFGRNAVLDFDIPTMAQNILKYSAKHKVEPLLCVAQGVVESHLPVILRLLGAARLRTSSTWETLMME